jgi:2-methylcitrate dehydratase PrpD
MTATDEILALAAPAASAAWAIDAADADLAAFQAAAARGADSRVARALRELAAARPAALPAGPALAAWLSAAAAIAAAGEETAQATRHARFIVSAAAAALADPGRDRGPAAVTAAIAAGTHATEIVESRLARSGGWSAGTVAAAIGAALAAGSLLRLAEPQLRNAIGICATQAAGLRAATGTDAAPLQAGKAAFNGVEAALLARAGLSAPAEPLDGRRGLFVLFG